MVVATDRLDEKLPHAIKGKDLFNKHAAHKKTSQNQADIAAYRKHRVS